MAEMTAQEAEEWGRTLDFPTVWAALMETKARLDKVTENVNKASEKADKALERIDKTGERIDRTGERIDKNLETLRELTKAVGGLHNSMGDLVETLFAPHLGDKFDVYNYNLKRIFRRVFIYDETSRQRGEIDILLSDSTVCMAVEIKRWLDSTDKVDEHIKRMQLIRKYPPAEAKGKKLLGAILGAVVTAEAREYAEQNGFFVLELTGEDVRLFEPPKGFKPKEW